MDDNRRAFRLLRQPRKPGSGRLHRPLELSLTTSVAGARFIRRRGERHAKEATDGPGLKPAVQYASPLCRSANPAAGPLQRSSASPPEARAAAAPESHDKVFHAFDPSEGSVRRVLVVALPRRVTRRRTQPRTFTLAFKPPPLVPRAQAAPPPAPALGPPSPASLAPQPSLGPQPAPAPADAPSPAAKGSDSADFEPDLEDLVILAFEAARAAEHRRHAMRAAAAEAGEAAAIAHAAAVAEEASLAAAGAGQLVVGSLELAARTPAPCRAVGPPSQAWLAHATPARPHTTPIEGVPERLTIRKARRSVGGPANADLDESCSTSCSLTPIEGVPERLTKRPHLPAATAASSPTGTSSVGLTPVEGVPERLIKRPRLLEVPWVSLRPGKLGGHGPLAADCGQPLKGHAECRSADSGQQGGASVGAGRTDRVTDENWAAAALSAPDGYTPDRPADDVVVTAAGVITGNGGEVGLTDMDMTAAELAAADMTAADIAAAASAAARAALQRIRPFIGGLSPLAQAEPAADVATSSHTCVTTPGEPASSSSGATPAVVKMQNLAAAAVCAVQRATQAMGGPPSCASLQRRQNTLLPPRPPSAGDRVPSGAAGGTGGPGQWGGAATAGATGADSRRASCVSDGANDIADLIHRAPPGTLVFPSRTPSPMGGFRWPSIPQGATPHLNTGTAAKAALVTPTLEAAAATLANGSAAGAVGNSAACAVTPGAIVQPSCAADMPQAARKSSGAVITANSGSANCGDAQAPSAGAAAVPPPGVGEDAHAQDSSSAGEDEGNGEGWAPRLGDGGDEGGCYDVDDQGEQLEGISGLQQEDDHGDEDDEAVAMEEVMALPEEPQAGRAAARGSTNLSVLASGRSQGTCSGDSAGARNSGAAASSHRGQSHGPAGSGHPAQSASALNGGSQGSVQPSGGQASAEQQSSREGRKQGQRAAQERRLVENRKSLAGIGLTVDELGTRRSTRNRVRPLEYWRGEGKSYGRAHKSLPTVKAITMRTPEPNWPLPTDMHEKAKRKARAKKATQTAMDA